MRAVLFYLFYPLLYLVALLPFPMVYMISDFFYHIVMLIGYRKKVVLTNLRNSFPEKSEEEIQALKRAFFHYLCDLILETLKTLTMTEREAKERCVFHNTEWLDQYYKEGQSIINICGHYGNWEWAGPGFTLTSPFQLTVVYKPLSNKYFEKMMCGMRTKFGTQIIKVKDTLRDMVANRKNIMATTIVADQTPSSKNAYWTTFMNQDTPVYTGTEKLASKFKYPVVYINIRRIRRGYYEIIPELLFAHPEDTKEGEISEAFIRRLEKEIIIDPTIWLWSHRRWKYKRETN